MGDSYLMAVPVKKPGSVCRVRVTQNTPQVSAITLEHCPPSAWNRVRHRVEYALIVLKNSAEACFWPMVCVRFVIDGGAHHDGSDGFTGTALLRFQPR